MKGKVRWFNNGIGWGRIRGENGKDYHTHFANILTPGCGFRTLAPDEEVEFKVIPASGDKISEAVEIKRSVVLAPIDSNAPTARFEKVPWAIEVEISDIGGVSFPQFMDRHTRDSSEKHVEAYYLGHPGSFERHNNFSVTMPLHEVEKIDIAVYLTNEEGGVIKDRAMPGFKPGNYVVTVVLGGDKVFVSAKKISLRTQDSRHVTHPNDKGVWLVNEVVYADTLEIPTYEDCPKVEQELKRKIEALIPAEFEWPTADNRKFAKAIARGVLAIKREK